MRFALLVLVLGGCKIGYDAGEPLVANRVQSGSLVLADGTSDAVAVVDELAVDNSFLIFSVAVDSDDPDDVQVSGEIEDGNTLRFSRSGTESSVTIQYYVVTSPDIDVQRDRQTITSPSTNVALSPVDRAATFPLFSYFADGNDFSSDDMARAELVGDSSLVFDINDTDFGDKEVAWQVVTLDGSQVESGTLVIGTDSETASFTLAAPAPDDSFLLFSHDTENPVSELDIAPLLVRGQIADDSSALEFSRGALGAEIELTWYLVSVPTGWRAQRGTVVLSGGELATTISFDAVDVTRSFAFGALMGRGGRTARTDTDSPGNAWATVSIDSSTTGTLTRASATARGQLSWFVVEMP